ncbi:MAG: hypothetical protein ACUVTE_05105 [Candidatus Bathycorpusculaceae bacterium]
MAKSFTLNMAKAFLGKNVNLHLKDGSVIVNVQLSEIQRDPLKKQVLVKCIPYGNSRNALKIPLRNIAWAKLLNLSLIKL